MSDPNLTAFEQVCEMIRHLQSLRFTVLTAFLVLSGALFTVAVKRLESKDWPRWAFLLSGIAGIVVAIVFGLTELRISLRIDFYSQKAVMLGQIAKMHETAYEAPPGMNAWMWITRIQMLAIYLGAIFIWIFAIVKLRVSCRGASDRGDERPQNQKE